ncbi:lactococcin 972 family bacteriocin [Granulicatella seriolae]|uniref:lactococcin 972 family bacteriocin n=1 Tax=Granulicatella seriolae TaxID=2967226 RepID=UPI0038B3C210
MKGKLVKLTLVAALLLSFLTPVLAVSVQGGEWSYGGHHDPVNWGAFSNYYHPTRHHWSSVVRHSDSKSSKGYAGAGGTSKAFVNTQVGEGASFDFGF